MRPRTFRVAFLIGILITLLSVMRAQHQGNEFRGIVGIENIRSYPPIAVALSLIFMGLVVSIWQGITNSIGIEEVSLADIERRHPYLPSELEVTTLLLVTVAFGLLLKQFIGMYLS